MKVDYSKTFIYKLCCRDFNVKEIYVGHSTDFKSRNQAHKFSCNNINSKKYNQYNYRFIRENGGFENWSMIKLYDFPCNSKREAEAEECKTMIELGATLNSQKAFVSEEKKKEHEKEQKKEYRKNNKTEISEKRKVKYENNKTEINEKRKVKIKCELCGCEISTSYLNRHQKTLKCMKFKEFIDVE